MNQPLVFGPFHQAFAFKAKSKLKQVNCAYQVLQPPLI